MAKQPRVWTGTQWDTLAVTLPDLSNYSTTTQMNTAIDNAKGLVLINSTTISTAAQVDFTNVFTSTYDNYQVQFQASAASAHLSLNFRFLSGTTPSTAGIYDIAMVGITSGGSTSNLTGFNFDNFSICLVPSADSHYAGTKVDIFGPYAANFTALLIQNANGDASAYYGRTGSARHRASTSYDGFRLFTSTGTVSGTVRVYGYRKS